MMRALVREGPAATMGDRRTLGNRNHEFGSRYPNARKAHSQPGLEKVRAARGAPSHRTWQDISMFGDGTVSDF
jgi:hypothetical protein